MVDKIPCLKRSDTIMFAIFYVMLGVVMFFGFPEWICFILLISVFILHIIFSNNKSLLYPFIIYPFMFAIRAPDPDGILLPIFPDVVVIFSIIVYMCKFLNNKLIARRDNGIFFVLLVLHIIITVSVLYYHVFEMKYIPILIRAYFMPLLFLLVIMHASMEDYIIPHVAIRLFVISIAIVAFIALSQYFNIFKLPSNVSYLQPVAMTGSNIMMDGSEELQDYVAPRFSIFSLAVIRINLLTGGAIGTSGAIFVVVSILCFARGIYNIKPVILYVMGIFCLAAGLLTASASIVIPVVIYLLLIGISRLKKSIVELCPVLFISMGLIYCINYVHIVDDISVVDYFISTIGVALADVFNEINLNYMLFGIGPAIFTQNYYFRPDGYIIDIGILRVFQETGFLNFLIFITFMFGISIIALKNIWNKSGRIEMLYALLFLTLSLMVHVNCVINPPFNVLFAASVAGILSYKERY